MGAHATEIFGAFAVTAMMLCYALEPRDRRFTLAFALACLSSAVYAVLIGSWPFTLVELVWAGVAMHRFRERRRVDLRPMEHGAPRRTNP